MGWEREEHREYRDATAEMLSDMEDRLKRSFDGTDLDLVPELRAATILARNAAREVGVLVRKLRELDPSPDAAAAKGEYMANVLGPER